MWVVRVNWLLLMHRQAWPEQHVDLPTDMQIKRLYFRDEKKPGLCRAGRSFDVRLAAGSSQSLLRYGVPGSN
ncbi:hypothetical protein D3C87_1968940 [compost metagenome]